MSIPSARPRRDARVTAVVFSLNEADLLADCLELLTEFDEVLVCDMHSTDDTAQIAAQYGARVLQVPVVAIVESVRQLAVDAVATEWIIFVDADERIPLGFRAALDVGELPVDVAAVRLRYDNVAFGRHLHHALRGSAKFALVRADLTRYDDVPRVHRPPEFDGPTMDAPSSVPSITHLNFRSVDQSAEKVLRYARHDPRGAATFASPFRLPREIVSEVVRGEAWRDGRAGVTLVTLNAIGRFYAAALEWELAGYPDPGWNRATRRMINLATRLYKPLGWTRAQHERWSAHRGGDG